MTDDEKLKLLMKRAIEWKTILRQPFNDSTDSIIRLKIARDIELTFIEMEDTTLD